MCWMGFLGVKKNDQRLETTKPEKALKINAMRWFVIWWMERMNNYP